MFSSYRVIFQHPGTKAFSGAGFIARMTVSMMGIGIITMIAQLRDSFFMAGVTAAVYTFSAAFCAPLIALAGGSLRTEPDPAENAGDQCSRDCRPAVMYGL